MKYETPELTTLAPAINAVQRIAQLKTNKVFPVDSLNAAHNEMPGAYEDWE